MTGQPQPNRVSSLAADTVLPVLPDRRVQFWKWRTELLSAVTTRSLPVERHREMARGLPESQVQRGAQAPLQDWLERERNKGTLSLEDQRSYVSGGVKQRMSSLALAGVNDQGQISKLLSRLERHGLVLNTGGGQGQGAPNEWRLTPAGQKVEQGAHERQKQEAA